LTSNQLQTTTFYQSVKEACPNGVDVHFDNVGGETSDVLLVPLIHARIALCGQHPYT
jgi:NADPH-dependent curcumin reductase CurA